MAKGCRDRTIYAFNQEEASWFFRNEGSSLADPEKCQVTKVKRIKLSRVEKGRRIYKYRVTSKKRKRAAPKRQKMCKMDKQKRAGC